MAARRSGRPPFSNLFSLGGLSVLPDVPAQGDRPRTPGCAAAQLARRVCSAIALTPHPIRQPLPTRFTVRNGVWPRAPTGWFSLPRQGDQYAVGAVSPNSGRNRRIAV